MTLKLEVRAVGDSTGIILPAEILQRLCIKPGDVLHVIETPTGIELVPYEEGLAEQLEVAKRVMHEERGLLRKLADS